MSRRVVAGLVIVGLLLAAAGCGSDDSDDGGQTSQQSGGAKEFKLGVSMIDLSNPFFVSMRKAGLKAAEDYGVEASFQSADGSLEKQIGVVEMKTIDHVPFTGNCTSPTVRNDVPLVEKMVSKTCLVPR